MTTTSGMSVALSKVTAVAPYGFFVQWEVRKPSVSGEYRFWLYRSGSSAGPWTPIASDLRNKFCFFDKFDGAEDKQAGARRPNQLALFRQFYYKVEVLAPNGERDDDVHDADPPLPDKAAQHYRRAVKNFQDMLRFNGRDCIVLKRKRWGIRCPKCSDPVLREPTRSSCTTCWGTGFTGGYWEPVLVSAYRSKTSEVSTNTPEQRSDTRSVRILLPNVPDVERDDVLFFLHDRHRFLVERVSTPEILQNDTHQTALASEIPTSSILYRFPVSEDGLSPLVSMPLIESDAGTARLKNQHESIRVGSPLAVLGLFVEVIRARFRPPNNDTDYIWREDPTPEAQEDGTSDAPRFLYIEAGDGT